MFAVRAALSAGTGFLVLGVMFSLPLQTSAQGVPPGLPANYFGSVVVNGSPPPDGTQVKAFINGKDCTQTGNVGTVMQGNVASYAITVPHESQIPGCGREGIAVSFEVGGQRAVQQATWSATTIPVNLSVGAATPPPLPTFTPTATPNATQANATATAVAIFTPLPAPSALPTDEPLFPVATATPGTAGVTGASGREGSGDSSLQTPLIVVLIVLVALGIAGGIFVSRRRSDGDSP